MLQKIRGEKLTILKGLCFAALPVAFVILLCMVQGVNPLQVKPLFSGWNDEPSYYKQLEGLLRFGSPLGYFGYNDSTATIGTLGAWSPVFFLPYIMLSFIFGLSPFRFMVFNLGMVCLAFFIFYLLVKPGLTQMVFCGGLFLAMPMAIRYTYSGMVEAVVIAAAIIAAGFIVRLIREKAGLKCIIAGYTCLLFLSLCRPYFAIFVLLLGYLHFKQSRRQAVFTAVAFVVVFSILYFCLSFFVSAYFYPLINTQMFVVLRSEGLLAFFRFITGTFFSTIGEFVSSSIRLGINANSMQALYSSIYVLFLCLVVGMAVMIIMRIFQKKKDTQTFVLIICLFCTIAIVAVIVLMYSIAAGSRHMIPLVCFLGFVLAGIFPKLNSRSVIGVLSALSVIFVWTWFVLRVPHWFPLPTAANQYLEAVDGEKLKEAIWMDPNTDNKWDNTVAFLGSPLTYSYYLPAGVGIQIYILDFDFVGEPAMKAKYVITANDPSLLEHFTEWEYVANLRGFTLFVRKEPALA